MRQLCDEEGVPAAHCVRAANYGTPMFVAELFEGLLDYDWETDATPERFHVLTLVVLGELEDRLEVTEPVVEAMPRARRVALPGVGHLGALIDTERVLARVQPFLKAVATGREPPPADGQR